MADNNNNTIKPVEGLQNIARLSPANPREERRRRRELHRRKGQAVQEESEDTADEEILGEESVEDTSGQHSIDYCA
jgi:hypothetical protein